MVLRSVISPPLKLISRCIPIFEPLPTTGSLSFQTRNLVCTYRAFKIKRSILLVEIAESGKGFIEQLIDRAAAGLRISGHLAKHDPSRVAILVANKIRSAVTITFFAPINVKRRIFQSRGARF